MAIDQSTSVSGRLARSRWTAVGAAVAVTMGASGILHADQAPHGPSSPAVFVAATPCRLIDTREAPETVGPRSSPLSAGDTYTTQVTGANGRCTLPADASTLVMNVTVTNQTAASFLTVFPAGSIRPATSSLNWNLANGDTANAVTANISASGELSFYNLAGEVDVVADVVGYYTSAPLDGFYTKSQVDALIAANPGAIGPAGAQGPPGVRGEPGAEGPAGEQGDQGDKGDTGDQGDTGDKGDTGDTGASGVGVAAEFYALLPGENGDTVALGQPVKFDSDGPSSSDDTIVRDSVDSFIVTVDGLYRVTFMVPVDEAGQLIVSANGTLQPYTNVGRAIGATQIVGDSLVRLLAGASIQIVNASSSSALTLSDSAGGVAPAVASLIIELVEPGAGI